VTDDSEEDPTTSDNTVDREDAKTSVTLNSDSVMETSLSSSVTDLEHTYCGQMNAQTGTPLVVQLGQPSVVHTDVGSTVVQLGQPSVVHTDPGSTVVQLGQPSVVHTDPGSTVVQLGQPGVIYTDPGSTVPDLGMVEVHQLSDSVLPSTQVSTVLSSSVMETSLSSTVTDLEHTYCGKMNTQTGTPLVVQLGQPSVVYTDPGSTVVQLGQPGVVYTDPGSTVPDLGMVEVHQLSDSSVLPSAQTSTVLSSDVTSSVVGTPSVIPVSAGLIHLASLISDVVQPTGSQQYSQPAVTGTQQRSPMVVTRVVNSELQHITLPVARKHMAQVTISHVTPVTANHTPSAIGSQTVYEFIQPQHTVLTNQQHIQPQSANQQPVQSHSANQQPVQLQHTTLASQKCVQQQSANQHPVKSQLTNQQPVQLQHTTLTSQQRVQPQSANQQPVQLQHTTLASQKRVQPKSANQQPVKSQSANQQPVQLQHTTLASHHRVQPRNTSLVNRGRLQPQHTESANQQRSQSGTMVTSAKPQLSLKNVRGQDRLAVVSGGDEMSTEYLTAPVEPAVPDWVQYNTQPQQQQRRSLYVEYDTLQPTHQHRLV